MSILSRYQILVSYTSCEVSWNAQQISTSLRTQGASYLALGFVPLFSGSSLVMPSLLVNPSCPLQTLNGEGQQEADDLQLKALRRNRVDLSRKHSAQVAENRLDVLASGLAQELLPCGHWTLGVLLALGLEV